MNSFAKLHTSNVEPRQFRVTKRAISGEYFHIQTDSGEERSGGMRVAEFCG